MINVIKYMNHINKKILKNKLYKRTSNELLFASLEVMKDFKNRFIKLNNNK